MTVTAKASGSPWQVTLLHYASVPPFVESGVLPQEIVVRVKLTCMCLSRGKSKVWGAGVIKEEQILRPFSEAAGHWAPIGMTDGR